MSGDGMQDEPAAPEPRDPRADAVNAANAENHEIERYLDGLVGRMTGSPRTIRRTLAEVEAHLYDSYAEELAAGRSEHEAGQRAVERIGPVTGLAEPLTLFSDLRALLRDFILVGLRIGTVAALAYAMAGAVARIFQHVYGPGSLGAPWPQGSYSAAECASWMAGRPQAANCDQAQVLDHAQEFLLGTELAGIVGVLGLAAWVVLGRRWRTTPSTSLFPRGSAEAIGAALALAGGLFAAAQGRTASQVAAGSLAGRDFSLGVGAALALGYFLARLWSLRRAPLATSGLVVSTADHTRP